MKKFYLTMVLLLMCLFSINTFSNPNLINNEKVKEVTNCGAPLTSPTGLSFNQITYNSVSLGDFSLGGFNPGHAENFIVYINSTNSFTPPSNGSNVTIDANWNNNGQQVVYAGPDNTNNIITNLNPNTTYYVSVQMYLFCNGLYYFNSSQHFTNFTTASDVPTVYTSDYSNPTTTSVTLGGEVTLEGGDTVTETGIVMALTSVNNAPQLGQSNVQSFIIGTAGLGSFSGSINLSGNSGDDFSYRAYATNSFGTAYGDIKPYSIPLEPGVVTVEDFSSATFRATSFESNCTEFLMTNAEIRSGSIESNQGVSQITILSEDKDFRIKTLKISAFSLDEDPFTLTAHKNGVEVFSFDFPSSEIQNTIDFSNIGGINYSQEVIDEVVISNSLEFERIRIFEFEWETQPNEVYYPLTTASDAIFGQATTSTISLNSFTAPADGADGYLIYLNDTNTFLAPTNGSTVSPSSTWTGAGQQAVYKGTSVNPELILTGLDTSTTYYVQIYAYNDCSGSELYESNGYGSTFATTLNTAPTFTSTPVTSVDEGATYTYNVTTTDADGDNVTVTATTLASWLSFNSGVAVSTLAGSGTSGFADGDATTAQFGFPIKVAVDASGNVYVADYFNHRIRKITAAGVVSTLAGSGVAGFEDGPGANAQFSNPNAVAVDASGTVYVADGGNHRIRKITPVGVVSTLAGSTEGFSDGTGSAAQFRFPFGVTVDASGHVYVADRFNHRIRKITQAGVVSTLAGSGVSGFTDGTGSAAQFNFPLDVAVDASGTVYVADSSNHRIRKITQTGVVSTLAGSGVSGFTDGTGSAAQFNFPLDVTVDASGTVYVADSRNHRIRKITPTGVVSIFAGSTRGYADGTGESAQFNQPTGVTVDASGTVYVADADNSRVRVITQNALTGTPTSAEVGDFEVVLQASDGNGGVVNQSYTITVNDITPPVITSVIVPDPGTYREGQNLDFALLFNEQPYVDVPSSGAGPQLEINIGGVTRQATFVGIASLGVGFSYTVQADDLDLDGIEIGALSVNGGAIGDAAGNDADLTLNNVGSTSQVFVDTESPMVTNVAAPASGKYNAGRSLGFSITFNEDVNVDYTSLADRPQLSIDVGGVTKQAVYGSGSRSSVLTFFYSVQPGDTDTDGITVGTLSANGGSIRDIAGNDADLTLNNVESTSSVLIDTTSPFVTSVKVPANGSYGPGQNLEFTVNFNENVFAQSTGGWPYLIIIVGSNPREAYLQSGSGTSQWVFSYTIQAGESDSDGITIDRILSSQVEVNDEAGNDPDYTLNNVGSTSSVFVDTTPPVITSVSVPTNATYTAGENLDFTVNFNENVTVDTASGSPQIIITVGTTARQAVYQSGSGTRALVFRYTAQVGDIDTDGIDIVMLAANGGTLRDAAGNDADLTLDNVGATTNVLVDARVTSAPTTAYTLQIYAGTATINDLQATGTAIQWYDAATGGNLLSNTDNVVDETIYYASQTIDGIESTSRLAVTTKRISEATQTFSGGSNATVADLVTTPTSGATANWFTTSSGGTELTSTSALTSGTYYVEQQTLESTETLGSGFRSPAEIVEQADGKILVVDIRTNEVTRMNADGTNPETLGSGFSFPYGITVQADGKILVANAGGNEIIRMDVNGTNLETLGSGFRNPNGVAVQEDGKILVVNTATSEIKRMDADGTNIETLGSGFSFPRGIAVQADGKILIANTAANEIKRMNADGTGIETLGSGFSSPYGITVQADGKILIADSSNNVIKRMDADGTNIEILGSGFVTPRGIAVQADGKILVADTNNELVKRLTEANTTNRVAVTINFIEAPTTANTTQIYAGTATISDLQATGTDIKWYDAATGGNLLSNSDNVVDGTTYYASQTIDGVESTERLAVTTKKISEAEQTFLSSNNPTVADLVTTPTTGATAQWYATATGGTELATTDNLATGTYYVEQQTPESIETFLTNTLVGIPDVGVLSDGRIVLLTTDEGGEIYIYNADGTNQLVLSSSFADPSSLVVLPGDKILVADGASIKRMDADGSNIITLATGFSTISDMAIQSDGKILIIDRRTGELKRMDADGSNITILATGFDGARSVAVEADGKILIADLRNSEVKRMDADGSNIVTLASGFNLLFSLAVKPNGQIYIGDSNRLMRMDADGSNLVSIGGGFRDLITSIAIQPDGKVLAAQFDLAPIIRLTEASTSNRVAVDVIINTTPTITFNDISKTYGEASFDLEATSNSTGEVTYSIVAGGTGTASLSGTTNQTVTLGNAGTVTLKASVAETANFEAAEKEVTLTIAQRAISLTAQTQSKVYGITLTLDNTAFTVTDLDGDSVLPNGELIDAVSLSSASGVVASTAVAATYPNELVILSQTGSNGFNASNYTITYVAGDFVINYRPITITAQTQSKVYGTALTLDNTAFSVTDLDSDSILPNGESIDAVSLSSASGMDASTMASVNTFTDDLVISSPTGSNGFSVENYSLTYIAGDFIVDPRPITITAQAQSKVYGTALTLDNTAFTVTDLDTDSILPNGELIDAVSLSSATGVAASKTADTGTYADELIISSPTGSNGFSVENYSLTYVAGDFEITPAEQTGLVFADNSFTYDGSVKSLTVTVLASDATVTYTDNDQIDAGTYAVTATVTRPNYTTAVLNATLSINKAAAVITANAVQTFTYDTTVKNVNASLNHSETTLTYAPQQGYINAGSYPITVSAAETANYLAASENVSLVIEPATQTGLVFADDSFTYDGSVKSLVITGQASDATVTYTDNDQIDAGTYAVTATVTRPNYTTAVLNATLSINKAAAVITANAVQTFTYDTTVKNVNASLNHSETTLTYAPQQGYTNAGTYTINIESMETQNYQEGIASVQLIINKAPQAITFNALATRSLENDPDFQLVATASSGLPVTYSYTFTSPQPAATVSPSGFVDLQTSGQIQIIAAQPGNANYETASSVQQSLNITSSNAVAFSINIDGQVYNNPPSLVYYLIDCENGATAVDVSLVSEANAQVSTGSNFSIATPAPGVYRQEVVITSQDGTQTRTFMIMVEKAFDFDAIIVQKYNNTLVINNNPLTNGGYSFVSYKWYKNGRLVAQQQAFSEGDNASDRLDPNATYQAVMVTTSGDELRTCVSRVQLSEAQGLSLHQNPIAQGIALRATAQFPEEELTTAMFYVYDLNGRLLMTTPVTGIENNIQLPDNLPVGIYKLILITNQRSESISFIRK